MKAVRGFVQLCMGIATALLHDKRTRRLMMFWVTLVTMVAVFCGGIFWLEKLARYPWVFVAYWLACLFGVILMLMLAILDFGYVTKARRRELRELQRGMAKYISQDEPDSQKTEDEDRPD